MPSPGRLNQFKQGVYVIKTDRNAGGLLTQLEDGLYYLADDNALKAFQDEAPRQGIHAGISRKIYRQEHALAAMREARVALMQDFIEADNPCNTYHYRSSSAGRLRHLIHIIALAARDRDIHVALHLLGHMREELKNGQYNIRQALFASYAVSAQVLGDGSKTRCMECVSRELSEDCITRQCDNLYLQHGDIDMLFEELCAQVKARIQDALRQEQDAASDVVRAMIEYINENYHRDISLKQLSEKFYLNPGYICRIFKRDVGLPLSNYLVHLRIRHACRMLRHSAMTVADIAQRCGYSDYFYFARQFKRIMNVTPTQYRKMEEQKVV